MIDINTLLKSKHIEMYKTKYFTFYFINENEKLELSSIAIFNKKFKVPNSLRKWTAIFINFLRK